MIEVRLSGPGASAHELAPFVYRAAGTAPAPDLRPVLRRSPRAPPPALRSPRTAAEWRALEPRGVYARLGRRLFLGLLLAVTLPIALVLALGIALVNWAVFGRLQDVLFRQPRVGHRGQMFWIYKFRTMRAAARSDFESWGTGHDRQRVTRFGRFLRNTHLDELPQFLNVLRGEMDLIGPRPEMLEIDRWACERIPGFRHRNMLRPGITGYAQITQGYAGRDETVYAMKLRRDLRYCESLSLGLDLRIFVRTLLGLH